MSITQSDSNDESEEEIDNIVMAFTGKFEHGSESSDEEIIDEELAKTYKILYNQWKEACMIGEKQNKTISVLLLEKEKLGSTIAGLEEEVALLKSKLDNMTMFIRMLNNVSKDIDEIVEVGKMSNNVKGIRFNYKSMRKEATICTKKFEILILGHMSQQLAQHMYPQYKGNKNSSCKFHHCGRYNHIRPY